MRRDFVVIFVNFLFVQSLRKSFFLLNWVVAEGFPVFFLFWATKAGYLSAATVSQLAALVLQAG